MDEKERREAIEEQLKRDKEECEHESYPSGECLEFNEMCFYEDQTLCPEYGPKYKINKK